MDALLLEKAELQQSLVLSRKDLERNEQKAKVKHTYTTSVLEAQHPNILAVMKLYYENTLYFIGGTCSAPAGAQACRRRSPKEN